MDLELGEAPLLARRFCSLVARSRPAWCRHGSPRDPVVQEGRPRRSTMKPCEADAEAPSCAVLATMIDAIGTSHRKRNDVWMRSTGWFRIDIARRQLV